MAKTWAEVTCYSSHEVLNLRNLIFVLLIIDGSFKTDYEIKDDIMDVAFGDGASFLLSCSRDSTVKLYGDSDAQQPMES